MRKVAIIGATGLIGKKLLEILCDNQNKSLEIIPYASEKSENLPIKCRGNTFYARKLDERVFEENFHTAFFVCEEEISRKFVPMLACRGVLCIDNSKHFRLLSEVPLVIPSVNACAIGDKKILANPNCTTIQIAAALSPLKRFDITQVEACTYQAASGAGKLGLDDLLKRRKGKELQKFPCQLYDNLIPQIDAFCDDGYTGEERKIIFECAKILNLPPDCFTATCVRVPVSTCHSVALTCHFGQDISLGEIKNVLRNAQGIEIFEEKDTPPYPTPIFARDKTKVYVGRVRINHADKRSIHMFVVADNLLRGGAYNAYEIAKNVWEIMK